MDLATAQQHLAEALGKPSNLFDLNPWRCTDTGELIQCDLMDCDAVSVLNVRGSEESPFFMLDGQDVLDEMDGKDVEVRVHKKVGLSRVEVEIVASFFSKVLNYDGTVTLSSTQKSWNVWRVSPSARQ